jgi:hypothetical protein
VIHLLLGWPVYLLFGVTGGSDYGAPSSHFWPGAPFGNGQRQLFPNSFRGSMLRSTLGVLAMLVLLGLAAMQSSPARVLCVYGLPYLGTPEKTRRRTGSIPAKGSVTSLAKARLCDD